MQSVKSILYRFSHTLYRHARSLIYPILIRGRSAQVYRDLPGLIKLFDEAGIPYWLGGGIAYDAIRGYRTRPHKDIDLSVLLEDIPRIEEMMVSSGFTFSLSRRTFYVAFRRGLKVDIFAWASRGAYRESRYNNHFTRVHAKLFENFLTVLIEDYPVRITPVEVMHVFLPMVENIRDREFIMQQPISDGYRLVKGFIETPFECLSLDPIQDEEPPVLEQSLLEKSGER